MHLPCLKGPGLGDKSTRLCETDLLLNFTLAEMGSGRGWGGRKLEAAKYLLLPSSGPSWTKMNCN